MQKLEAADLDISEKRPSVLPKVVIFLIPENHRITFLEKVEVTPILKKNHHFLPNSLPGEGLQCQD